MDVLSFFSLLGGLALFLYGMTLLSDALQSLSARRLQSVLSRRLHTPFQCVLWGAGITAVIQSSSATTSMVVGLVNAGVMSLSHAAGVIMGANVGTTLTAWLFAVTGLAPSNLLFALLTPDMLGPLLSLAGVALLLCARTERARSCGRALMGLSLLFTGLSAMTAAVKPLTHSPRFLRLLTLCENPAAAFLSGALVTAVVQSSSASVGILQALCASGRISYYSAIPIIGGQNTGTCITALLACIGAGVPARRAALLHLYFNLAGVLILGCGFYGLHACAAFSFLSRTATPSGVAIIHSVFNLLSLLILFPFSPQLERLARASVPDRAKKARSL